MNPLGEVEPAAEIVVALEASCGAAAGEVIGSPISLSESHAIPGRPAEPTI